MSTRVPPRPSPTGPAPTPRVTLARVNAALAARGHAEILVRGRGYYYFAEGDAHRWPSSAVYTAHLTAHTVLEWAALRDELARRTAYRAIRVTPGRSRPSGVGANARHWGS